MYIFFDTETTGLPKNRYAEVTDLDNWPRLVQIAWLLYDISENQVLNRSFIVKPEGFTIPYDSTLLHGISTERALEEGLSLETVLTEFSEAITQAEFLIAHNMSFDEKIVGAEFLRTKISNSLFQTTRICTMTASTEYCQIPGSYGFKWPTLSELYFCLFQSDFEEKHDASIDVIACAKCFFELRRRGITNI